MFQGLLPYSNYQSGEEGVRGKGKLRGYAGLTQVVRARCKRLGVFLNHPLFGAVVVSEWGVAL